MPFFLEFRDPISKVSLAYNYLIVATTTQILVYAHTPSSKQFSISPKAVIDIPSKGRSSSCVIVQCSEHFVCTDGDRGIQVIGYDGKVKANIKTTGASVGSTGGSSRSEPLSETLVAVNAELLAYRDRSDDKGKSANSEHTALKHTKTSNYGKSIGMID